MLMPAGPFRSAAFRRVAAADTVSMLGNAVAPVALAFAVLDLGGSASALGVVVGARSLANVLFLLVGGVVADRLPRQVVLLGSSAASAVTQGVVAVLVIGRVDSIALLAGLSAVNGAVSAFSMPAAAALLPATVEASLLRRAYASIRILTNTASVAGAALAGILVAALGSGWAIAVDAASFAVAGAIFAGLRLPYSPVAPPRHEPMWTELAQGWEEFRSRTWLWVVVASAAVGNAAFVGSIQVLGPVIADHTFGRRLWGVVLASLTVGMIAGGLLAMRTRPRFPLRFGMACTCFIALPPLVLGLRPVFALLVASAVATGVALEQFGVAWSVTMQHQIPADRLARAYSYDMLGSFAAIPLGEVLIGPIAARFGTEPTLVGAAVLILGSMLAALASRSVRNLTNDEPVLT